MNRYPMLLTTVTLLTLAHSGALAQEVDYDEHFRVFTGGGKPASLDDVVRAMGDADVVFIGETHTDPVGHWIEAELLRRALASGGAGEASGVVRPIALSLEMFERDVQEIVDEYLAGYITEEQFTAAARPWDHYATDYRPMVELAKEAGIPVIAANAPRRYVNRVSRLGPDALSELPPRARSVLPPLPYPPASDAYREEWMTLMREMPMVPKCDPPKADEEGEEGEAHPEEGEAHAAAEPQEMAPAHAAAEDSPPDEGPTHMAAFMENAIHAQALWDASMAHALATFLEANPGALVLHPVGGFHVENHTGIPEQVQFYRPGTRSLVVSMETVEEFRSFDPEEYGGQGDFVILTDKRLDLEYERFCTEE